MALATANGQAREWAGDERRRRAEHGGVGTPHSRGASGKALGASADKASLFFWRLRAGWFVGSVTRRRGGPPAHRPSGRGPGCGFASDHAIPTPNPAGGGFVCIRQREIRNLLHVNSAERKLLPKKRITTGGVLWGWELFVRIIPASPRQVTKPQVGTTTAAGNSTTIPPFWIRPSHLTWHWEEQKQSTSNSTISLTFDPHSTYSI